ncbi:MAG: type VI secretion system baseplate subunit TssF [Azoarcus sp.]|jgi:type VI secretion system protein ImpG|nr:type VI secretion system baseplate subunit TssF [Azoarcus sp.]
MLESLLPYYERELGYLRELSGEFARRYPKVASRLALEGGQSEDPHIERLIESFAFLGARIHRKLDDEYPEITASFLEVMLPHYLRPIPASSIVQFEANTLRPKVRGRYSIARGQAVYSPMVDGVVCQFRTCYPVDLFPVSITTARLELTSGSAYLRQLAPAAAAVLTLELQDWAGLKISGMDMESLRFFLDGDPALMHLLHELLLTRTVRVRVGDGSDDPAHTMNLPGASVAPVGFASDEAILEYDKRSFAGYRLLTEYFSFPEKFLFVDFLQLGEATARLPGGRMLIQVILDRYPGSERHHRLLTELGTHHFKLGCTPIINLFTQAAEPIRVTHQRESYPVRINGKRQDAFEVVRIERVTRVEISGAKESSNVVPPFYDIVHAGEPARFYWHSTREASTRRNDRGTDLELHLVDLDFEPVRPAGEVLSLELLCSNRDLPERIPFGGSEQGDLTDFSLPGQSVVKRVRLLRKPTPSQRLPQRRGLQWRLISHLSLNYLSLTEKGGDTLREMLTLYNLSASPVMLRQIQGIGSVDSRPAVARVAGPDFSGFVRGSDITLVLDEDAYVGGSVYLFASVLERFFALYCALNSFTRLHVYTVQQRGEKVLAWPARAGESFLI